MKRMTDKAKKIYTVTIMAISAVVAVAAITVLVLYFAVESLREVFIIKNCPIIVVCVLGVIIVTRILVENVIFRKDFVAGSGKYNGENKSGGTANEQGAEQTSVESKDNTENDDR